MNWDAIGAIAELFGAAAVLVTLVYFSLQLFRRKGGRGVEFLNCPPRPRDLGRPALRLAQVLGFDPLKKVQ